MHLLRGAGILLQNGWSRILSLVKIQIQFSYHHHNHLYHHHRPAYLYIFDEAHNTVDCPLYVLLELRRRCPRSVGLQWRGIDKRRKTSTLVSKTLLRVGSSTRLCRRTAPRPCYNRTSETQTKSLSLFSLLRDLKMQERIKTPFR